MNTTLSKDSCIIIIPAFNEGSRLSFLLKEMGAFFQSTRGCSSYAVRVVDDGSLPFESETMREIVESTKKAFCLGHDEICFVRNERNGGKGSVLRSQFLDVRNAGKARYVGFLDADAATSFEDFRVLHGILSSQAGVHGVIGCRLKCLGKVVERSLKRHIIGRVFTTIISLLFRVPLYDSQCGAKVFRVEVLDDDLFELCDDARWLFDTQVVIALWARGKTLWEWPVSWKDVPVSRVSLVWDPIRMFMGLCKFRRRLAGRYVPSAWGKRD